MRIATAQPTPELPAAQRGGDSHQGMVGASGQRLYTFFLKDESIHEIEAADADAALEMIGKKIGKCSHMQRYWLLQEIEACLTLI